MKKEKQDIWMPLYIGEYLADTAHLDATGSGAYLHLIMHYWRTGGLPKNCEKSLARIAKLSAHQWKKYRGVLAAFFGPGWTHKRIDRELKLAADQAAKASEKGRAMAEARYSKQAPNDAASNAYSMLTACSSPSPSPKESKKEGFQGNGGVGVKRKKKPPRHGATGNGRIWISAASQDWAAYAADYFRAHGEVPPTEYEGAGRWFRVAGEALTQSTHPNAIRVA